MGGPEVGGTHPAAADAEAATVADAETSTVPRATAPTPGSERDPPLQPVEPAFPGRRPTMTEATAHFDAGGVQPGEALPPLALLALDGAPVELAALQRDRPLLLVTCSLTCNVARRQQPALAALQQRLGDRIAIALVYTIDAHPCGDPSPYSGEEWGPPANEQDGVLVRQPATLGARLALARRYAREHAGETTVLVDTMDNAGWRALGGAPNAGVLVRTDGVVAARCGWFDAERLGTAAAHVLATPADR